MGIQSVNNIIISNSTLQFALFLLTLLVFRRCVQMENYLMQRPNKWTSAESTMRSMDKFISNNLPSNVPPFNNTLTQYKESDESKGMKWYDIIKKHHRNVTISRHPPLEKLIDVNDETRKVVGDVNFLLDFVIAGFAKCGTSTMMYWLANHTTEIQSFRHEVWHLRKHHPERLVQVLYDELLPAGEHHKRGYKGPADIEHGHIIEYYRTMFPKTKLIIGIRHPIDWFESMYNFRIQNANIAIMKNENNTSIILPVSKLRGRCKRGMRNCCTYRTSYAYYLIRLGKQYLSSIPSSQREPTELECNIAAKYNTTFGYDVKTIKPIPNPVFLYELSQLSDTNITRAETFRNDVKEFLGLQQSLPIIGRHKPGKYIQNTTLQQQIDQLKINICDDEHADIRNDLLEIAQESSIWIRKVFINSPTVYVSSREYFANLLEKWMVDPCIARRSVTVIK